MPAAPPPAVAAPATAVPWAATPPPPSAPPAVYWATTDEPGPAPGIEFAGHGGRFVAYILDGIIVTIIGSILFIIGIIAAGSGATVVGNRVTSISTGGSIVALFFWLLAILAYVLYFPFFWARGGQTPGMRPFGLRIVRDRDGSRIGWGTALLRLVGLYVAFAVIYIGVIWIFIDKRRRGWQDLIAGTVMIKRP
jgi:uncharacterized RDD family membrane protein YckC